MATAAPLARTAFPNRLLSKGGDPGDDDTAISLAPNLSALCQSYIGKLNTYEEPRPNVDQINHDQFVQAGTQLGCDSAQNETTIAVNLANPRNLVAGANDYRVFNTREGRNDGSGWAYTTFDGGRSWLDVQLPHLTYQTGATDLLSDMDAAGDPAVAFGPHNTVYYANLVFSRLNGASGITVSKSTDGGRTWGEPSIVHTDGVNASGNPLPTSFFNDKEWITVDQHLSITHMLSTHVETEFDVSQSSYATPDDHVPWRTIAGACKVTAELGELGQAIVQGDTSSLRLSSLSQPVQQVNLKWREHDFRRGIFNHTIDHRHPEYPPAQNAKHGHQIDESLGGA